MTRSGNVRARPVKTELWSERARVRSKTARPRGTMARMERRVEQMGRKVLTKVTRGLRRRDAGASGAAMRGVRLRGRTHGYPDPNPPVSAAAVHAVVAEWPLRTRRQALSMLRKYGDPDELGHRRITWYNTGLWKRTIVYRDGYPHDFPTPHLDAVKQVVNYRVPPEAACAVAQYNGSLVAHRTAGELASFCADESLNLLSVNLAHQIVLGRMSADEARDAHRREHAAVRQGAMTPLTSRLRLRLDPKPQGDRDPSGTKRGVMHKVKHTIRKRLATKVASKIEGRP